jgi:hypothetical protein
MTRRRTADLPASRTNVVGGNANDDLGRHLVSSGRQMDVAIALEALVRARIGGEDGERQIGCAADAPQLDPLFAPLNARFGGAAKRAENRRSRLPYRGDIRADAAFGQRSGGCCCYPPGTYA